MDKLDKLLKLLAYIIFTALTVAAIIGIYTVVNRFGSGTSHLIAPTIFVLVMGTLGLIDIHKNKDS